MEKVSLVNVWSFYLQALLTDETISNVPVLILGNKIDRPEAISEDALRGMFGLHGHTTGKVIKKYTNKWCDWKLKSVMFFSKQFFSFRDAVTAHQQKWASQISQGQIYLPCVNAPIVVKTSWVAGIFNRNLTFQGVTMLKPRLHLVFTVVGWEAFGTLYVSCKILSLE